MTDFTTLSKTEWILLAEKFNTELFNTCSKFTTKEWNRHSTYVGWRVRDVMVNITRAKVVNFWQLLDLAMNGDSRAPLEFNTFVRGQREMESRKNATIAQILDEFKYEYDKLINFYKNMSDEDWLRPGWFFVGPMNVRGLFLTEFGDNVFHLRDMLLPNHKWNGLNPAYTKPLTDWFLREYRPAHFRADKSKGIDAKILYRLSGAASGAWTMRIKDQRCKVYQGADSDYDVIIAADVEDLVAVSLARSAPWVGATARYFDWIKGKDKKVEVVATVQHYAAFASAIVNRKIRFGGNKSLGVKINRNCFWHFYQRTAMTEQRIRESREQSPSINAVV